MISAEKALRALILYGQRQGLLDALDAIVATNALLDLIGLQADTNPILTTEEEKFPLTALLQALTKTACQKGKCAEGATEQELFFDRIMGFLTPRQSEVVKTFIANKQLDPKQATSQFYALSGATNYIKTEQIARNIGFFSQTPVGNLEITINLSKPEKDPRDIAKAKLQKNTGYPQCVLCLENIGFAGSLNQPSRQNHRVIPLTLNKEEWFFQFSPYVYYNQHAIIFKKEHEPMAITGQTFQRFFDFLDQFPHYFIGSNADLPIVGGSILNHEHFQAGCHPFAMESCKVKQSYQLPNYPKVKVELLEWPLSVIRLTSQNRTPLEVLATTILQQWQNYSNEEAEILAFTNHTPHNTITPIARLKEGMYQLDLVLRNNRTTAEHPLGLFHPHNQHHHIKKENIGLIEVLGLAILPGRLLNELNGLSNYLDNNIIVEDSSPLYKHTEWLKDLRKAYKQLQSPDKTAFLYQAVGEKFLAVLNNCGVFKNTPTGLNQFNKFMQSLIQ